MREIDISASPSPSRPISASPCSRSGHRASPPLAERGLISKLCSHAETLCAGVLMRHRHQGKSYCQHGKQFDVC